MDLRRARRIENMSAATHTPSGGSPVARTEGLVPEKKWSWPHPADGMLSALPEGVEPRFVARNEYDLMWEIRQAAAKRLEASVVECQRWRQVISLALQSVGEAIQEEEARPDDKVFARFGIVDPSALLREPI